MPARGDGDVIENGIDFIFAHCRHTFISANNCTVPLLSAAFVESVTVFFIPPQYVVTDSGDIIFSMTDPFASCQPFLFLTDNAVAGFDVK